MSRSRIALVVLLFAALMAPASTSASSTVLCSGYSTCTDKGYPNFGYSTHQYTSYWRMYTGSNCTNYVAYRLVTTNGMPNVRPAAGVGNAEDWGIAMASITNATPAVGAVAWWDGGHHVAYIEKVVSSTEILVSESHWQGTFDWRRITKSGSGWPDGFIHFTDLVIKNTERPSIPGTVAVGLPIKADGGTWSPQGNTYHYRWYADGVAIPYADERWFTPTATQEGHELSVRVRATRTSYPSTTVMSRRRLVAPGTITPTTLPVITGSPRVDEPLSAAAAGGAGTWSPTGNSYAFQWLADDVPVTGATTRTFTPGPALAGKRITFAVTATRPGYTTVTATSSPTAATAPGALANITRPTVTGDPRVGSPLRAAPGTWSKPALTYAYQWYVAGNAISGATAATYVPNAADLGLTATVRVKASRAGYDNAAATSPPSAAVARGTIDTTTPPSIAGTPRVGVRLTAMPGHWPDGATMTYQWYDSHGQITGATGSTYTPGASRRDQRIRVRVTVRAPGYTTATDVSAPTARVAAGRFALSAGPRVRGTLERDDVVTAEIGIYTPSSPELTYQWLRDGQPIVGATGHRHRIHSSDLGHLISVRVTARKAGYVALVSTAPSRRVAD